MVVAILLRTLLALSVSDSLAHLLRSVLGPLLGNLATSMDRFLYTMLPGNLGNLLVLDSVAFLLTHIVGNIPVFSLAFLPIFGVTLLLRDTGTLLSGNLLAVLLGNLVAHILVMLHMTFFLIPSVTLLFILIMTLFPVAGVALLFWNIHALFLRYRGHFWNLDGVAFLSRYIFYLVLIYGVALSVIVHVTLLFIVDGSVRFLHSCALLSRFIPAFLLVDSVAHRCTSIREGSKAQEKESLNEKD